MFFVFSLIIFHSFIWAGSILEAIKKANDENAKQFLKKEDTKKHRGFMFHDYNDLKSGWTELHYSALNDHLEKTSTLLAQGAKTEEKNRWGMTPLHYTLSNGQRRASHLLLAYGANIYAKDHGDRTTFYNSTLYMQLEIARLLQEKGVIEVNPDIRSKKDWTHLQKAIVYGPPEKVKELLEKGANPNQQDSYGLISLHFAIVFGTLEMVHFLYEKEAKLNTQDNSGFRFLDYALVKGDLEKVNFLLEKGANPNQQDNLGWTLLYKAIFFGQLDIAKALLAHGAKPDKQSLNLAKQRGNTVAIELIQHYSKKTNPCQKVF